SLRLPGEEAGKGQEASQALWRDLPRRNVRDALLAQIVLGQSCFLEEAPVLLAVLEDEPTREEGAEFKLDFVRQAKEVSRHGPDTTSGTAIALKRGASCEVHCVVPDDLLIGADGPESNNVRNA